MMFKRFTVTLGLLIAVSPLQRMWACSFCPPDLTASLLKEVDSSGTAVFAELIRLPDPNDEHPTSSYRVSVVLKGDAKKNAKIDVPLDVKSPLGSIHLFLRGEQTETWENPRGVSSKARSFLELASKLPVATDATSLNDRTRRLAVMLPHLISKDRQIANSVYGEFATAPDSAVRQLKPILNHNQLKAWIELEPVSTKHRRLMFTLLAVCGDARDLPFVKAALDDRLGSEEMYELDAIIATYLTLAGNEGLSEIDRRLLNATDVSRQARHAAARALRFHVDNVTAINRNRLIASCRLLLADPDSADYVISDLARWKDWESLDAIIALRNEHADHRKWLRAPIRGYLEACPLPAARSALASATPVATSKENSP